MEDIPDVETELLDCVSSTIVCQLSEYLITLDALNMILSNMTMWTLVCLLLWTPIAWGNKDIGYYAYTNSWYFNPLSPTMAKRNLEPVEQNAWDTNHNDSTLLMDSIIQQLGKSLRDNDYDPQPLPDRMFDVRTTSRDFAKVRMSAGRLYGMSNLRVINASAVFGDQSETIFSQLEISRLKVLYSILLDVDGWKTKGELTVKTNYLLLNLALERQFNTTENLTVSLLKMSETENEQEIEVQGLEFADKKSLSDIEKRSKVEIQNLLLDSVKKYIPMNLQTLMMKPKESLQNSVEFTDTKTFRICTCKYVERL